MSKSEKKRILLQVSGSIAAFKAISLCSKLVQLNYLVDVVLSEGATHFVGAASFEGLTKRKIHFGNFDEGSMMAHIDLERAADLILLYPASANTLSHLAQGQAESLIGSLFLAHEFKKPYFVFPAMNQAMLSHPATVASLEKIKSWGIQVFEPGHGTLACGEVGAGRLIEPEAVVDLIQKHFGFEKAEFPREPKKKILITAGGTRETIDPVRSITNLSSGETGYALANSLQNEGYEVTLLQSKHSRFQEERDFQIKLYDRTLDFQMELKQTLESESFDACIHAAAVADYRVIQVMDCDGRAIDPSSKIQHSGDLLIRLTPNPKIIQSLRSWSLNPKMKLISFKLTTNEKDSKKFESYDSEWIIHNSLASKTPSQHAGEFYEKNEDHSYRLASSFQNKRELNLGISQVLQNLLTETRIPTKGES